LRTTPLVKHQERISSILFSAAYQQIMQRTRSHVASYYDSKIASILLCLSETEASISALNRERQELASKVSELDQETQKVQQPSRLVGEVIRTARIDGTLRALVMEPSIGKYVLTIPEGIQPGSLSKGTRVVLEMNCCGPVGIHRLLPEKEDPEILYFVVKNVKGLYSEIIGLDKQLAEVREIIELPLTQRHLFTRLGICPPKGVLLYGPPGTGKTSIARAVANEGKATFFRLSGNELVKKYLGEGTSVVRKIFAFAKKCAPYIIFIDGVDGIGCFSTAYNESQEVRRTLLELVNQLDGFEQLDNVQVIMETSRIEMIDSILLRPGRVDRKIHIPLPDQTARLQILLHYSKKMNIIKGIEFKKIADRLDGTSAAAIKAICVEAGMFALKERRTYVTEEDFELAVAKELGQNILYACPNQSLVK